MGAHQLTVRCWRAALQATAQQQVEASVGRVEAALQSKLAKTQTLAQSLEQALSAVNHEHAGLSRSQQRLNAMVAHLKQKADINRSRQQVCAETETDTMTVRLAATMMQSAQWECAGTSLPIVAPLLGWNSSRLSAKRHD